MLSWFSVTDYVAMKTEQNVIVNKLDVHKYNERYSNIYIKLAHEQTATNSQ